MMMAFTCKLANFVALSKKKKFNKKSTEYVYWPSPSQADTGETSLLHYFMVFIYLYVYVYLILQN